jgi:DNA end-binding protein Ku
MVAAKTKKKPAKQRASWRGNLAFSLVSFPVQAFNALSREGSDIHFHQLHVECHRRIHYQKVCPVHGEVSKEEIVSGYEYRKGRYVEIEPEELDALRTRRERTLKIDAFVECGGIDPLYYDGRMYYLSPDGAAAKEPYHVIAEAMEREERCGIGQVVFSGKEQLALVRPIRGVLHMAMLNYAAEIQKPETVVPSAAKHGPDHQKLQLARSQNRSGFAEDVDFEGYEDRYRQKVQELIRSKIEGREIVEPREEEEEAELVDLMDALQKSLRLARKHLAEEPRRMPADGPRSFFAIII